MLNIINQRNVKQNHKEVSPHTCQNDHRQKDHRQQMLARMWREENPVHCCWECKMMWPLWKTVEVEVPQKTKNRTAYNPTTLILSIYLEKNKNTH